MRKSCIKATCFLIFVLVNHFNLKAQQIIFTTSNFASGFDISCHGAADGRVEAAVIWESPPYTFQWSNGAYTSQLNNITAGQYILTITNAIAQTYTDTINLLEPEPLDAFVYLSDYFGSNISGNGRSDGEIILEVYGGSPEYSFLWSNSSQESRISNIPAGTYSVTITDGNECTKTLSRTLIEPQVLQITGIVKSNYNGYNVSCKGINDGWAEVNVIGGKTPYSYRWSNGQFAIRAVDLSSGSHQIEVTDANNIKVVANIVLTQPTSLFGGLTAPIGVNGYHITCFQCANGTASTSANGGVTPYTYQWSNGSTASSVSGLSKGEYIVTVTDKNGCPHQSEFEITEPLRENWTMTGNANTNAAQEFIGTTDSTDFTFKTNSTDRLKIGRNGKVTFADLVGIGDRMIVADQYGTLKANLIPWTSLGNDNINSDFANWPLQFIGTTNESSFVIRTFNVERMRINPHGSVGIGTSNTIPYSNGTNNPCKLGVNGSVVIGPPLYYSQTITPVNGLLVEGNVGIGDTYIPPNYKLAVNGKIICEEVFVKLRSAWPDYVFKADYKLMPVNELKQFIISNGHLPELKSQAEVEIESGITLGENQVLLVKKIEELTLYIINQEEKIMKQNEKIEYIENQFYKLLKK